MKKIMPAAILDMLDQRSHLKKVVTNTGWLLVDKLLKLVAGFFVGAWVARYLGPSQYGVLNYALAFEALFVPLARLGLANLVVRDIVRVPESKDEILGTTFVLQFVASCMIFGLIIAIMALSDSEAVVNRWLIAIVAGQLIIFTFSDPLQYWFQSQVQSKYPVWANNVALVLISVVKIVLIILKAPLVTFAWALLIQTLCYTITLAIFYRLSGQKLMIPWKFSLLRAKDLLANSWPLILSGLAMTIYMKISQIMLGNMIGNDELGIYSAAVRLSELWYFIPMAIASSAFPVIVHSRENLNDQVYQQRMQLFFDIMTGIAYLVTIPFTFVASPLVAFLYGSDYMASGPILVVHIWAFIFVSIGVARSQWLVTENRVRFSMFASILGAVVNILLNYWLIPKYAGLGAAWATLISYVISTYVSTWFSAQLRPLFKQLSLSLLVPFRLFSVLKAFREI